MNHYIHYRGESLGMIKDHNPKSLTLEFIAGDFNKLKTLLDITPEEKIDIVGIGSIPYAEFEKKYLKRVKRFYTSLEDWTNDNMSEDTTQN